MRRRITITHPNGLHARPAADLARLAQSSPGGMRVIPQGGAVVDAASVLAVMQLTLESGAVIDLEVDDPGADGVLDAAAELLAPAHSDGSTP